MTLPGKREIEIPLLEEIERAGGATRPRDLYGPVAAHFPEVTEADLEARHRAGDGTVRTVADARGDFLATRAP